jgi:hypothetical protein
MTGIEETRWNAMDGAQRHDWLLAAGEHNITFKFLDWQELPEPLAEKLIEVYKG